MSLQSPTSLLLACIVGLCTLFAPIRLAAQSPSGNLSRSADILSQQVAQLLNDHLIDEATASVYLEHLEALRLAPIDLNTTTFEQLLELPLLGEYAAYQLILFRTNQGGRITDLADIKGIEGWGEEGLARYRPFITLGDDYRPPARLDDLIDRGKSSFDLLFSYPSKQPINLTKPLGTPEGLNILWRWRSGNKISLMIGADKDRYEPWRYDRHKGFDSYSGHFALKGKGFVRQLIFGDYRTSWSEGLILRQGFNIGGLSSLTLSSRNGTRAVQGTSESSFSRGITADIELSNTFQISLLGSWRNIDGRISPEGHMVTNLSEGASHRTTGEWDLRHQVLARQWGGQLRYQSGRLSLALSHLSYDWGGALLPALPRGRELRHLPPLKQYANTSFGYHYTSPRGQAILRGEVARSQHGYWATTHTLAYQSSTNAQWVINLRHSSPSYWAYYGQALGSNLSLSGISVLALSMSIPAIRPGLNLSTETHLYQQAYPLNSKPTEQGYHLRTILIYQPFAQPFIIQLSGTHYYHESKTRSTRINLKGSVNFGDLKLTTLASTSLVHPNSRTNRKSQLGYALGIRSDWSPSKSWRMSAMLTYHNSPNWQTRLYLTEPRLSRYYAFSPLWGKGWRWTLIGHAQLSKRLKLSAQWIEHESTQTTSSPRLVLVQLSVH